MENTEKRIEELFKRLDQLIEQQQVFQNEIGHIRDELRRLRNAPPTVTAPAVPEPPTPARRICHCANHYCSVNNSFDSLHFQGKECDGGFYRD